MDKMEPRLVAQALNYHGQQLQKVWESERNESELAILNIKEPSFEIYQQRQKTLSFSDRGKRLKLQQFIAKKADTLYDKSNLIKNFEPIKQELGDEDYYATMPGLDSFVSMEKSQRIRNFLESLLVGDVIFAQVMGKSAAGLLLKVLCNCSDFPRVVPDLGVKALILNTATVPAVDKKGVTRGYMANDLVCVVVGEVNVEAERVVAVMNVAPREGQTPHPPMGLIHPEDLPDAYKKAMDNKGQSYETIMQNSPGFNNPNNIKYLCDLLGLGQVNYSNMIGLRERFPPNEYATELRQAQASKWAFRSVAEGIDHFKAGRHSEAFQCLNKALTVDPKNVEGLVARGALYANSGSFKKAIDDFETALKLNPTHANARKYMAETLVALGRSYEDEKKFDEAVKAYENCLTIAPYHEEARNSIEYIKSKTQPALLPIPLEPSFKNTFEPDSEMTDSKKDKKKRKKDRKSRSKKRHRWSSSSSSSSGGSSSSSSTSDSSGSSSSTGSSRSTSRSPNRKKKHKKEHHGSSLSPLSKRMAQYNPPSAGGLSTTGPNSHDILQPGLYTTNSREKDDYELKVRKFLEQTKDDSDYEEKVRKFLEETARWKREKEKEKKQLQQQQQQPPQHLDIDKTKKKKKKEKKPKDKDKEEKKLRKKKKKEERRRRKNKDKLERDFQATMPDLDQLESKLNAYYAKVEKETAVIKSNTEKLTENSRREDRSKERDEAFKVYHERDSRMNTTAQRKDTLRKSVTDLFEQDSQLLPSESKLSAVDTGGTSAKWKAIQGTRRDQSMQKWDVMEKKLKAPMDSDEEEILKPIDKSLNIRKQMQREISDKRSSQQMIPSQVQPHKESPLKSVPIKYPTPQPQNKFQMYNSSGAKEPINSKFSAGNLGHKFQPIGQTGPNAPQDISFQRSSKSDHVMKARSRSGSGSDRAHSRSSVGGKGPNAASSGRMGSPKRYSREHDRRAGSRSRSRSGSSSRSSRSRSHRSHSRSYSGRRSGSYERKYSRSPSGTYSRSRSRSRSRSYSRSRSRSRSGDRGYYRRRQFRTYNNNRGTYYKPRFQPFNQQNNRGNNQFQNRNRFNNQNRNFQNRNYDNRRNFQNRGRDNYQNRGRMPQRGRYFHRQGYRDNFRDRREYRDRRSSRDRYSDRSYSPDPMRKVDEAKEKINKMIEDGDEAGRRDSRSRSRTRSRSVENSGPPPVKEIPRDGPSEGEDRDEDDYERWGEGEGDKSEDALQLLDDGTLGNKDDFIQRMKQRSQNVLIKRELEAKTWFKPPE